MASPIFRCSRIFDPCPHENFTRLNAPHETCLSESDLHENGLREIFLNENDLRESSLREICLREICLNEIFLRESWLRLCTSSRVEVEQQKGRTWLA